MHVGIFCDEFREKGSVICGLSQKVRRETTLFRPILVVRFVISSRHPLFLVTIVPLSGAL
jgi:hypothetical protein